MINVDGERAHPVSLGLAALLMEDGPVGRRALQMQVKHQCGSVMYVESNIARSLPATVAAAVQISGPDGAGGAALKTPVVINATPGCAFHRSPRCSFEASPRSPSGVRCYFISMCSAVPRLHAAPPLEFAGAPKPPKIVHDPCVPNRLIQKLWSLRTSMARAVGSSRMRMYRGLQGVVQHSYTLTALCGEQISLFL